MFCKDCLNNTSKHCLTEKLLDLFTYSPALHTAASHIYVLYFWMYASKRLNNYMSWSNRQQRSPLLPKFPVRHPRQPGHLTSPAAQAARLLEPGLPASKQTPLPSAALSAQSHPPCRLLIIPDANPLWPFRIPNFLLLPRLPHPDLHKHLQPPLHALLLGVQDVSPQWSASPKLLHLLLLFLLLGVQGANPQWWLARTTNPPLVSSFLHLNLPRNLQLLLRTHLPGDLDPSLQRWARIPSFPLVLHFLHPDLPKLM